jgi:hypothetical protein
MTRGWPGSMASPRRPADWPPLLRPGHLLGHIRQKWPGRLRPDTQVRGRTSVSVIRSSQCQCTGQVGIRYPRGLLAGPGVGTVSTLSLPNICGRAFGWLQRYRRSDCPIRCGGSEVCTALAPSSAGLHAIEAHPCTRYACRTRGPAVDRRCSGGGVRVQPSELNRGRQRRSWCPGPVGAPGEVKGVQAQAIRAFLLALRRGQDPDTVSSGELGEGQVADRELRPGHQGRPVHVRDPGRGR